MPPNSLIAGMTRSCKLYNDYFLLRASASTPRKRRRLSVIPFSSFCDNRAKARSMCAR